MRYAKSPFRDFKRYSRVLTGLDEDNIQRILKQYNSKYTIYEVFPDIYSFKDLSEYFSKSFKKEFEIRERKQPSQKYDKHDSVTIKRDYISMITKLIVNYEICALTFDENSFFNTIIGFSPYWDYKSCDEHFSEKKRNLSTMSKINLKCDVTDGSILSGLELPLLFNFMLGEPPGYRVLCELDTIHFKKINRSALNAIKFHREDDNQGEVIFNEETLTFTLQLIKI